VKGRRIGLLGGTFDPIHRGHLEVASFARRRLDLDLVRLVTAKRPPHKRLEGIASAEDRHRMVELAAREAEYLEPDDRELRREGPSYTVDTLRAYRKEEPEAELFFIVGGDTIRELPSWYRLEEIVELARVVTVTRPGFPDRYRREQFPDLPPEAIERLNELVLDMPPQPISSTEIRRRAAAGEPIEGLVPPAVAEYIRSCRLYRASASGLS